MTNIDEILKILREALNNEDIAILKCKDGKENYHSIVCAVNRSKDKLEYIPLMAMINDPYKTYTPVDVEHIMANNPRTK